MKTQLGDSHANFSDTFKQWAANADKKTPFPDKFINELLIRENFYESQVEIGNLPFSLLERIFNEVLSQKTDFNDIVFSLLRIFLLHKDFSGKKANDFLESLKPIINFPSKKDADNFFSTNYEKIDEKVSRKTFIGELFCKLMSSDGAAPLEFIFFYLEKFPQKDKKFQLISAEKTGFSLFLNDDSFALSEVGLGAGRKNIFLWISDELKKKLCKEKAQFLIDMLNVLKNIARENYAIKSLNLSYAINEQRDGEESLAVKTAKIGAFDLLEVLINNGAQIDHKNEVFKNCLKKIYSEERYSLVIKLIERKVDFFGIFTEECKQVLLNFSVKAKKGKAFRYLITSVTDFSVDDFYPFICRITSMTEIPKNKIYILLLMVSQKNDFEKTYRICEAVIKSEEINQNDAEYILRLAQSLDYLKKHFAFLRQDNSLGVEACIEKLRELLPSISQEHETAESLFGRSSRSVSPTTQREYYSSQDSSTDSSPCYKTFPAKQALSSSLSPLTKTSSLDPSANRKNKGQIGSGFFSTFKSASGEIFRSSSVGKATSFSSPLLLPSLSRTIGKSPSLFETSLGGQNHFVKRQEQKEKRREKASSLATATLN